MSCTLLTITRAYLLAFLAALDVAAFFAGAGLVDAVAVLVAIRVELRVVRVDEDAAVGPSSTTFLRCQKKRETK